MIAGYGHLAPRTYCGKVVTMLYAIVGIPLTLLTISNLGGFMATAFRWFYKDVVCGVCCSTHCCGASTETTRRKAAAAMAAVTVEAAKTISRKAAQSNEKRSAEPTSQSVNLNVAATSSTRESSISRQSSRESSVSTVRWIRSTVVRLLTKDH